MFKEPKWTKKNAKRKALEYLHRYVPVTVWGPRVNRQSLVSDIIGGLIVGIMIVPTCLSWASLASIPLSCGLSGALFASFSYGTFGQCAYLSLGPVTEITTLLISISSIPLEDRELTYQSLGVQVGILAIILSFIDGGKIIKTIFSKAVGDGYTCAAAILAICVQMKVMFNVDAPTESHIQDVIITTIDALKKQFTLNSFFCFLLFFVYCGYLIQIKRFKLPIWIPHQLIVVIVSTLLTWGCRLDRKLGLTIVQELPSSISAPHFPPFNNIMGLAPYTLAITIISFVQMYVIAVRQMPDINPNGELFADGATNFFCNIFSGMPVTNSFSCSAVLLEQNVKTPLTAYAAGSVVLITIFGLNRLNVFYYLPKQCLAAIVVASVWRLVDFSTLIHLWKYSKIDALVWVLTFVLTIFSGITVGVLCGIAISLVLVVLRIARPRAVSVGFSMTTLRYGDLRKDPELLVYPNILMWRFDAPLYFVNYSYFQEKLTHALRDEVRPIDIIIATCAKVVDIDSAAMSNLPRIIDSIATLDPDRPRRIILTEIHGRLESVLLSTAVLPIYVPEEHDKLTMNQIDATGKFPVVFKDLGDAILFAQRYLFEKYGNVDISPYPHVSFVTDVVVETAKMQLLENNSNNNMHHGSDLVAITMHHDDLSGQGSGVEGNEGWREFEMIENGHNNNYNGAISTNNKNNNGADNNLSNAERNLIACLKKLRKISRFTPDKELIGVIGVVRHTELTPKQKKKFFFHEPELLQLAFDGKDIARNKRTPEELEPFFDVVEDILARGEMDIKSSENWRRVLSIIRSRPQGLKIQMKPVIDYNVGSFNESFCANASFAQKIQSALLVVKWGGVLTKSGIAQANVLGEKLFARFFAAGDLPLHRLIKFTRNPTVFASDENRVITTALVVMNSLNQHTTLTKDDIILNDRLLKTLNTTAKNLLHDEYKYFESLLHIDSPAATRHFFHIPGFRELLRVPQPTPEPEIPGTPNSEGELVHFISDMVEKIDEDIDKMDDDDDDDENDDNGMYSDEDGDKKNKKKNKNDKSKHTKVSNGKNDKKAGKNKKSKDDVKSNKTTSMSHAFSESEHDNKTSAITGAVEHHVDPHHMDAEVQEGHPVFLPPSKKSNAVTNNNKAQKDVNKTTLSQTNPPLTSIQISDNYHGSNNADVKMALHVNSSAPHQSSSTSLLPPLLPASQQQHQRLLSYAAQEYYTPIQVLQELELNMRTVVNMDIPSHIINVPLSNHETLKELRSRYEVMLNNLLGAKQRRTVEEIESRMHAETVNNFTNIVGGNIRDEDDDEDDAERAGAREEDNNNNTTTNVRQIQQAKVKSMNKKKDNVDPLSDLTSAHSNIDHNVKEHNDGEEDSEEDDDDEDENGEPLEDVVLNQHYQHHSTTNIPSSSVYNRALTNHVASPITSAQHTAPHHTVESLTHPTRSTSSRNAPYSHRNRKYDVSDVSKLRDYASYDIAYNLPLLRALFTTTRMTSLRVVIDAIMRISKITEGMSRVGENVLEGVNSSKRFIIGSLVSGQLLKRINDDFREISLSDERRGIEELLHRAQRMYIEANGGVEQDLKHFFNIFKNLRKTVRNTSFTEEYTETVKERELRKRFPFINLPGDVPESDAEHRETSHRQHPHEDEVSCTRFYFTSYLHVEGVVHCLFESDTVTGFSRPSKEELEASLQLYMKHLIFKVFRRRNLSYTDEEAVEALRKVSLLFTTDESYTHQQHRLRDELVAIYHAMFYVSLEVYLSIGDVDPNVEETEMTPIFTVEDAYPSNNLSEIISHKEDERTEMDEEGSIIGLYSQLPSPTEVTQLPSSPPLANTSNNSISNNNINNSNNNYLPSASTSLIGGVSTTNAMYDGPLNIFGNSPPINRAREEEASNSTPRQPGNRIPSSRLSVISPALLSTNAQERSLINRTPLERRRKTIVMQTPQAGQKTTLVQQMKNRVNSVMPMQRIHEGLSLDDFMRLIQEVESAVNSQVVTTNTANTNTANNNNNNHN